MSNLSFYSHGLHLHMQTGSGKTHTMLGDIEEGTRRHSVNCGMTPRVFEHLFSRIQKVGPSTLMLIVKIYDGTALLLLNFIISKDEFSLHLL